MKGLRCISLESVAYQLPFSEITTLRDYLEKLARTRQEQAKEAFETAVDETCGTAKADDPDRDWRAVPPHHNYESATDYMLNPTDRIRIWWPKESVALDFDENSFTIQSTPHIIMLDRSAETLYAHGTIAENKVIITYIHPNLAPHYELWIPRVVKLFFNVMRNYVKLMQIYQDVKDGK